MTSSSARTASATGTTERTSKVKAGSIEQNLWSVNGSSQSTSKYPPQSPTRRDILDQVWDRLWPLLSNARTEGEVTKAFQDGARPYDQNFVPGLSALTLQVLQEHTLPKRREPLQRFLADSLAGVGVVTPRRSRDICAQQRAKRKRAHHILRYEFYIECSCGYKGRSNNHACPKCGAKILFPVSIGSFMS